MTEPLLTDRRPQACLIVASIVLACIVVFGALLVTNGLFGLVNIDLIFASGRFNAKFERIQPGMTLAEVEVLMCTTGTEIPSHEVPTINDDRFPVQSGLPLKTKPAVLGDRFFIWKQNPEASVSSEITIGLENGRVKGKHLWVLSL